MLLFAVFRLCVHKANFAHTEALETSSSQSHNQEPPGENHEYRDRHQRRSFHPRDVRHVGVHHPPHHRCRRAPRRQPLLQTD